MRTFRFGAGLGAATADEALASVALARQRSPVLLLGLGHRSRGSPANRAWCRVLRRRTSSALAGKEGPVRPAPRRTGASFREPRHLPPRMTASPPRPTSAVCAGETSSRTGDDPKPHSRSRYRARGRAHAARSAFEKRDAGPGLEVVDALARRGGRDAAALRGARDGAALDGRHEDPERDPVGWNDHRASSLGGTATANQPGCPSLALRPCHGRQPAGQPSGSRRGPASAPSRRADPSRRRNGPGWPGKPLGGRPPGARRLRPRPRPAGFPRRADEGPLRIEPGRCRPPGRRHDPPAACYLSARFRGEDSHRS